MAKLTLTLRLYEKNALLLLAEQELRDPRAQAALIIRQELERRGLLSPVEKNDGKEEGSQGG